MLNLEAFRQVNHVIERDVTSSTYKYALLKNVINVVQRYDHLAMYKANDRITLPLGPMVEGWIFDYLPFVYERIRQQSAKGSILNRELEESYEILFEAFGIKRGSLTWREAYKTICSSYERRELTDSQSGAFLNLAKESAKTITRMPMKYIGDIHYGVFVPSTTSFGRIRKGNATTVDRAFLIELFGMFTISQDIYKIFRYFGQNLYGTSTIARRWKEKVERINDCRIADSTVEEILYHTFTDTRDTTLARSLLPERVTCIWTEKRYSRAKIEIDHMLPFSIWENNDLWNLMPASSTINNKKRDKIPSPNLLDRQKNLIFHYWDLYRSKKPHLFTIQVRTALGKNNEKEILLQGIKEKARYLIEDRGMEIFNI